MARFRNTGNSGGIKFRRSLSVDWDSVALESPESILGSNGTLEKAIVFGDPHASDAKGPIYVDDTQFLYYKEDDSCKIESTTGRIHKIVDGPFFKSPRDFTLDSIRHLTSLGSWVPNLPIGEGLNLFLNNLITDNVYEIRCIFLGGKKKTSPGLILNPGNYQLEYDPSNGIIAIGTFIATGPNIVLGIQSTTEYPPHINSIVVRHVETKPSVTVSQIRTIVRLKS